MNTEKLKGLMELYLFAASIDDNAFTDSVKELLDLELTTLDAALKVVAL